MIREYAVSVPIALVNFAELTVAGRRTLGIFCLSRQHMKDSSSAAVAFFFEICLKDILHVVRTEFCASESLAWSSNSVPRSSKIDSSSSKYNWRYSEIVMPFALIYDAACTMARGR